MHKIFALICARNNSSNNYNTPTYITFTLKYLTVDTFISFKRYWNNHDRRFLLSARVYYRDNLYWTLLNKSSMHVNEISNTLSVSLIARDPGRDPRARQFLSKQRACQLLDRHTRAYIITMECSHRSASTYQTRSRIWFSRHRDCIREHICIRRERARVIASSSAPLSGRPRYPPRHWSSSTISIVDHSVLGYVPARLIDRSIPPSLTETLNSKRASADLGALCRVIASIVM